MENKIEFENHFSKRVMEILFPDGFRLEKSEDLMKLKREWTANLKNWHSPYTCLFDVRKFVLDPAQKDAFARLVQFFGTFHMKKAIGFADGEADFSQFPFEVFSSYDEAASKTGLGREGGLKRDLADLRSRIQIENDFNAHVMEVSFLADTHLESAGDIATLKSKITNILRQWHSPYSLMFNCVNCTFSQEAKASFSSLEKFLKSFFCKEIIGYAPKGERDSYPFKMFRSRHLAAAELSNSGITPGSVANCSTRKEK